MAALIKSRYVRSFLQSEIQDNPDVLKGVLICEVGEAKGHGFYLGERFLEQVVLIGNRKQIKVRVDHPEQGKSGKVLSLIGQAFNFRVDGDKVRADIKLFDVPAKKIIQQLAKQAGDLFGMSLDFIGKTGKKLKNGLYEVFCKDVDAVDFVESPAATNSLFSEKVDSQNEGTDEKSNNLKTNKYMDKEILAALGLDHDADEKSIKAAILAACEAKKELDEKSGDKEKEKDSDEELSDDDEKKSEEKMSDEEDDKGDDKDKEKLSDDEKSKKDDAVKAAYSRKNSSTQLSEEKIEEIVTRRFTALLSKVGHKAKVNQSDESQEKSVEQKQLDANFGFSAEEVAFAKKEKIDLKTWRETLNKAASQTIRLSK